MAQHSGKMATCCYCGRRTALVLTGRVQHELACGSCGAPLHKMKAFPTKARTNAQAPRKQAAAVPEDVWSSAPSRPKRRKRRKSVSRKVASEIFDLFEDIFD